MLAGRSLGEGCSFTYTRSFCAMSISRHLSREFALQTLYAWFFHEQKLDLHVLLTLFAAHFFSHNMKELAFTDGLLVGVQHHLKDIQKLIKKHAPEWPLEKIALIDRIILSMGIYEVMYAEEVPDVVAINESIELAKKFGSDTSPKFVNGVLHSVMKEKNS